MRVPFAKIDGMLVMILIDRPLKPGVVANYADERPFEAVLHYIGKHPQEPWFHMFVDKKAKAIYGMRYPDFLELQEKFLYVKKPGKLEVEDIVFGIFLLTQVGDRYGLKFKGDGLE